MQHQLSIFDLVKNNTDENTTEVNPAEITTGSVMVLDELDYAVNNDTEKKTYIKWEMNQFFDELRNATALVYYKTEGFECRLPVELGKQWFSLDGDTRIGQQELSNRGFKSAQSIIRFNHNSNMLQKVIKEKEELRFFTQKIDYKTYERSIIEEASKARRYLLPLTTNMKETISASTYDEEKGLNQFVSKITRGKFRFRDNLLYEVKTLPFKIYSIKQEGTKLTIEGSEGVYIQVEGFKGIRKDNSLIFDVYNEQDGYILTFHF